MRRILKNIYTEIAVLVTCATLFFLPFFFKFAIFNLLGGIVYLGYPLYFLARLTQWTIKAVKKLKQRKQGRAKKTSLMSIIGTIMMTFGALFALGALFILMSYVFRGWLHPSIVIFEWWGIGFAILFLSGLLVHHLD